MITDPIKAKITRWSLERVQFLLSHLEDFIDGEEKDLKDRARAFVADGELEKIQSLVDTEPGDPRLPLLVLERLSAFFDGGLLLQRAPGEPTWWTTDLFWRGHVFNLDTKDRVKADHLVPELPPLRVMRAPAGKTLKTLNLSFLSNRTDADAFLIKPTPNVAYVLISNFGAPWALDHLEHTQRLINKCFIY